MIQEKLDIMNAIDKAVKSPNLYVFSEIHQILVEIDILCKKADRVIEVVDYVDKNIETLLAEIAA